MSTHVHNIIDAKDDPRYIINIADRTVEAKGSKKVLLIQGDHNSERFSFEVAKTIEGHDVLDCDYIQIHFWNKATSGRDESTGFYPVTDAALKQGDNETVTFSWLIPDAATKYEGKLLFSVMFYCTETDEYGESRFTYRWGTQINNSMAVVSSLNYTNEVLTSNTDMFSNWEVKIDDHLEHYQQEFDKKMADIESDFIDYVNESNRIIAEKVDAKIEGYVDGDTIQPTEFATESEVGAIFADETGNYEPGDYYVYSQVDTELDAESENPVQNKVITEALDNKVESATHTTGAYVYARISGRDTTRGALGMQIQNRNNIEGFIPVYNVLDGVGQLSSGVPTRDYACANKKYVDDCKPKKHTITVISGDTSFDIEFYSIKNNTDSVEYYDNEILDINADGIVSTPHIVLNGMVHDSILTISTSSLDHAIYQFDFSDLGFGSITITSVSESVEV